MNNEIISSKSESDVLRTQNTGWEVVEALGKEGLNKEEAEKNVAEARTELSQAEPAEKSADEKEDVERAGGSALDEFLAKIPERGHNPDDIGMEEIEKMTVLMYNTLWNALRGGGMKLWVI